MGCQPETLRVEAKIKAGGGTVGSCAAQAGLDTKYCDMAAKLIYNPDLPDLSNLSLDELKKALSVCSPFVQIASAFLPKVTKYIGPCSDYCHYGVCALSLLCEQQAGPAVSAVNNAFCTNSTALACASFQDMGGSGGGSTGSGQTTATAVTARTAGGSTASAASSASSGGGGGGGGDTTQYTVTPAKSAVTQHTMASGGKVSPSKSPNTNSNANGTAYQPYNPNKTRQSFVWNHTFPG